MSRKLYTEEQIAFAIRQHESGTTIAEITRKMGIAEQTFYRWKKPGLLIDGARGWASPRSAS